MTEDRELCQRCRNECGHADLAARLATAERTINEQNKAHAEYVSALEADFREAERDLANLTLAYTDALGERDEARAAAERDRGKAVWMPICYSCGNGPLAGDSIQTGLCDECGEASPHDS
jgi:hypothetical protein